MNNDAVNRQDNILGFSRTFVLKKYASGLVSYLDIYTLWMCVCVLSFHYRFTGFVQKQRRIPYNQRNWPLLSTIGPPIGSSVPCHSRTNAHPNGNMLGGRPAMPHDYI